MSLSLTLPIALAVLFGALLHASWNALIKSAADKSLDTALIFTPTLENLQTVFQHPWNLGSKIINSFAVAGGTVLLAIPMATMAAYAFSRFEFRFKKSIFLVVIASQFIPAAVIVLASVLDAATREAYEADRQARAHCRSISGEMHQGFANLRSALPMNLKGDFPGHKVWARALGDIERITAIWQECITRYGGPFLFGAKPCIADAMYAPVATRFLTYHVKIDRTSAAYCQQIMAMPEMKAWVAAARLEKDDMEEFDMEF